MKRFTYLLLTLLLIATKPGVSWGQNDCPAIPTQMEWDTNCFIPSNVPDDDSKGTGLWLPEAFFHNKYNGATGQAARIPTNRPTWALGIAHAWNYSRNIIKNQYHPKMSYWMATITQESQWGCDAGANWGGNTGSPVGIAVPAVGDDGCYQIEGVNDGSAYGALIQYYPLRFRAGEHPNLIGGNNVETSALVKAYYDIFTERIAEYRWGWEFMGSINNTCDPYAHEKSTASAYNAGIFGFSGAAGFYDRSQDGNCYWTGLPATTAGYATQVGDMISVLENNAAYPITTFNPMPQSVFEGYYNAAITWNDMLDYFDAIDDMYYEINFAADVIPNVQAEWINIAGSTATSINFQQLGPVIDQIILSLPREDAMAPALANDGSPQGPNGVNCSGNDVPFSHIEPQGPTEFCEGLSLDLDAIVDGGGGANPTYRWYEGALFTSVIGTSSTLTISPAAGTYTYWLEVCNGTDCYPACCEIEVTVTNCSSCGMSANLSTTNTPCKGMPGGSIDVSISGNASNDYEIQYSGITSNGNVSGTILSTSTNVNIPNLIDGIYNVTVIDRTDPSCTAFANTLVNFNTDINEYVEASLDGVVSCVADLSAELVELPAPCQWEVRVYPTELNWPAPGDTTPSPGWENWVNAIIDPSSAGSQSLQVTHPGYQWGTFAWETTDASISYYTMNTGDTIDFWIQVTGTPGATQNKAYLFELWDEAGNEVYSTFAPAGSADLTTPFQAGSYQVTCPYTPPSYSWNWSPSLIGETSTTTSSSGQANVSSSDVQYTVTATNNANPQCMLTDTVTVIGDPGCSPSCTDPGTASLSPSSPAAQCEGSITLTASETGSGSFEYEFFRNGVSVQGPGSTNTYPATQSGDYTVEITDPTDPGTCSSTSGIVTVTIDQNPTVSATSDDADNIICAGDNITLTGTGTALAYSWDGGVTDGNPFSPASTMTYTVTGTSGTCSVTDQITITVNEKPTAPTITVNPNQTTFCAGETYDLTASSTVGSGTITYTWSGDGSGTTNPLSGTTTAGSYTYIVTATANGCDADNTASQGITVNAIPTATISGGGDICDDGVTTANLSIDFTGTAPFSVDVERNAGAFSTESTSSDPHTVTTTQDGTYTITNLSDGNCAGTTSGTATVNYYDDVVATASMECDDVNAALANDEFQIRVTVTQGDLASINITELTAHGVNFTDQGGGVWLSDAINEINSVDINVTDANDCNGGVDITGLQQQCSCPATGTITLTGSDPVCPGDNSSLEVQFSTTVGSGPFNVTVTHPISGASTTNSATSPLSITINEVGAYSATIEDVGNGCTVSAIGSVSLSNHTPPTATISGTETICNDGVTTANLSIDFTGTAPFSVDVERNAGAFSTESTSSDPHTVTTTQDGTYTITNLSDGNCAGTTSGTATVSYYDDVVATAAMECDDVNAALADDEFQIRVTVTQGDLASINITELTAHGVNFADLGGGVWLSDAVNESNTVDINVTDANDCNGGIDITGLQRQCSCPTTATATITGSNPICPTGSSTLEVSFTGGLGSFDVTLTEPSGTQNQTSVTSPATFTISDAGNYTATVTNNGDACDATTTTVTLNHTTAVTPTVDITVDNNPYCLGTPVTFTATGTNPGSTPTYDWYVDGVLQQSSSSNTYSNGVLFTGQQVHVELQSSLACATSSTAVSTAITMTASNPTNPIIVEGDQHFCSDETRVLTAQAVGTVTWYKDGIAQTQGTSITIGSGDEGQWTIEDDNGVCPPSTSPSVAVNIDNVPTVSAGPDLTIEFGESTTLQGSTNASSISWDPAGDLSDATAQQPTVTPTTAGSIDYTITATEGVCQVVDVMTLTVNLPVTVPNVFTPNGDGDNDNWQIPGVTTYPEAVLTVFNRWGMPVYKSVGNIEPWDGTKEGQQMPVATYYYILDLNNGTEPMTGSVSLIR